MSGYKYTLNDTDIENKFIHLTNIAI